MGLNLEAATAALFARIGAPAIGFAYASRILEDWDSVPPSKQPALMLTSAPIQQHAPNQQLQGMAPPMWKVQALAVLYVQSPDPKIAPSTILNPLIEKVCDALLMQPGEPANPNARFVAKGFGQVSTTLGGLCAACYVSGTIERSEGLIGHATVASIPIEMVLTS